MKKQILSILLCVAMIVSIVPLGLITASAEEIDNASISSTNVNSLGTDSVGNMLAAELEEATDAQTAGTGDVIYPVEIDSQNLSLGAYHSAAITKAGNLYMWGENYRGQLGDGTTTNRKTPQFIMADVASVSLRGRSSASITKSGDLYVWGNNDYGQLGDGTTTDCYTPKKIMSNVVSVSLGDTYSAAITKCGDLYTWGDNRHGKLGNGTTDSCYTPKKIMSNVISVSLGSGHSAAITKSGDLYLWGENFVGQLGDGTYNNCCYTPKKIMNNVVSVSLGYRHSAAITESGDLYSWGCNDCGQLGYGTSSSCTPQKIMNNVVSVSLCVDRSAAVTKSGDLYMWGSTGLGGLFSHIPKKIINNIVSISLGAEHSAAIAESCDLYTWGYNSCGQLGDGTTTSQNTPTKITLPEGLSSTYSIFISNDYDPTGQIEFYSTSTVDNLKIGSEFYLDVGYYVNGTLQNDVKSYILTTSNDNVIITKTTNGDRGCRYLVQTVGLGSTTITATHPTTNKISSFTLNVTANNNVYTFDNIPKIAYEEGKETNIYNYSGLVVDSFNSEYINGEYLVTMNVYNSKNLYAAVTSYNSDGTIRDYCIIDKFEGNPTSFVNNLEAVYTSSGDLYYLIKNKHYYSGKSITKETPVTINVPAGGHIEISNNVSTSEIAMLANVVGLTVDIVSVSKEFLDILPSSTAGDLNGIKLSVIKKVTEKFCKEKILIKSFKKAAQETVMSGNWNKNNTDSFLEALNDKFQRFVNEDLLKAIEDSIFSVAGVSGVAESIILDILPTGPIINALYAGNSALNHMEFNDQFSRSRSFPTGVSIYAPQTGTEQITNGIKVQMNGNENTVMHAYKVVKSTPFFDKQEVKEYTYDIAMYKDGNETQPSSPVTVSIPMPSDFTRFEQVKVFHVKEDGSLTDMNAQVVAGNLVFTTNHFSEYTVIELPMEVSQLNIAGATLTLYDDISVNYMVSKDLFSDVGYSNPYMVFEFNGHKTTVQYYTVNGDYYSFSFDNVAPDKMNDTIKSTLYAYVGDTLISTDIKEYSIAKYCYSMLESYSGDNYSELRTLLVDLLNYGAYTQNYTGHNTENLVNANLTDEQKVWASGDIETFTDALNTKYATVDNPTVKWRGAELELNSAITMKFVIQTDSIEGLTVKITDDNGHSWTVKSSTFKKYADGYYYVYFNGLDASQMSDNIYLTVYSSNTIVSNTVRYSIESYASAMKDSTNDKLSTLVHSMMKYGNSAKQYKNKGVN